MIVEGIGLAFQLIRIYSLAFIINVFLKQKPSLQNTFLAKFIQYYYETVIKKYTLTFP